MSLSQKSFVPSSSSAIASSSQHLSVSGSLFPTGSSSFETQSTGGISTQGASQLSVGSLRGYSQSNTQSNLSPSAELASSSSQPNSGNVGSLDLHGRLNRRRLLSHLHRPQESRHSSRKPDPERCGKRNLDSLSFNPEGASGFRYSNTQRPLTKGETSTVIEIAETPPSHLQFSESQSQKDNHIYCISSSSPNNYQKSSFYSDDLYDRVTGEYACYLDPDFLSNCKPQCPKHRVFKPRATLKDLARYQKLLLEELLTPRTPTREAQLGSTPNH